MPDQSFLSLSGAKLEAVAGKTRLAASVLHLFNSTFNPSPTSPITDFLAAEASYAGYVAKTIATWSDPVLAGQGYAIFAPTQVFTWVAAGDNEGGDIGGSFLVTATGDLVQFTTFDPTRAIMGPDQAIITTPTVLYIAG